MPLRNSNGETMLGTIGKQTSLISKRSQNQAKKASERGKKSEYVKKDEYYTPKGKRLIKTWHFLNNFCCATSMYI